MTYNLTGPKGLQILGRVSASISKASVGCLWIGERVHPLKSLGLASFCS